MALFSQRKGIRPLQKAVQRESMDDELRNRLWSAIKLTVWDNWSGRDVMGYQSPEAREIERLVQAIWLDHFKEPVDTIPNFESAYQTIRENFFKAEWWEVYDFIEFLIEATEEAWSANLAEVTNTFLEAENAAYRVVDQEVVEITDQNEIGAIETAIEKGIRSVRSHIQRSLELLSDRKRHDYRNSIKEAISAVEAACQALSGNSKETLGGCLKLLKAKSPVHPALEGAFLKLYGYTSDSGGIRHALSDATEPPSFADAKFMLVACSAFTSFLWAKAAENGMKPLGS